MKLVPPNRVTLLDGSPIGNSPMEQFMKFKLLDSRILGYQNWWHFRAVHGVMEKQSFKKFDPKTGQKKDKVVAKQVGFRNQHLIDDKVKSKCEYLEQQDCLDMPTFSTSFLKVRLGSKAWRHYKEMRDDLITDIDNGSCSAAFASIKVLRLAQICAGLLGGVELDTENEYQSGPQTVEISQETTNEVVQWTKRRLEENVSFKCVYWCRWKPEVERLYDELGKLKVPVGLSYGSKKKYDGELHPRSESLAGRPYLLVAQPQSLRYGTNLSQADTEVFVSQDYNRITRAQSQERIQPGEGVRSTSYILEVLVSGPNDERTVTWDIKDVQDNKEEVARRTAGEWKKILEAE